MNYQLCEIFNDKCFMKYSQFTNKNVLNKFKVFVGIKCGTNSYILSLTLVFNKEV